MSRKSIVLRAVPPGLLMILLAGIWIYCGWLPGPSDLVPEAVGPPRTDAAEGNEDPSPGLAPPSGARLGAGQLVTAPAADQSAAQAEPDTGTRPGAAPASGANHPSDPLIASSRLLGERWSEADPLGNRERSALYQADGFKYPMLRVVEKWLGKTGDMESRVVMVADHLLAAPGPGVDAAEFKQRLSEEGFTVAEAVGESSLRVTFGAGADDPVELPGRIELLEALGDLVAYAEPDYLVWPCLEPNDPAYQANNLWGLSNPGGVSGYTAGADIDAPAGWAVRNDAGGVIVAVTDTGIRYDHEDLAPNMWTNSAEIAGDGIDNDANGLIDDVFGYDAYGNDGDPMDEHGHGTHCSGTIGARGDNGVGMTGVAWNVRLMAGRFLGHLGGTTSDGIKVIDYARQNGAHVISASWGGNGNSTALRNAITACANAGIPFVAAAGNSGTNNDSLPHYPSSHALPNIVAVAASNANDRLTGFSCYGRNSVDIAAPGWQILSCYSRDTSDYSYLHGTSMATPHVTGALALARAQFPTAGVEELIAALYRSSDKLATLDGLVSSGGRLNLHALLTDSVLVPPNNQFDTPSVLAGNYATWSGGNRSADREADESTYSPAGEARTLWFAWQAPFDGFASFTATSLGAGQRVLVFSGETRASLKVIVDSGSPADGSGETTARFLAEAGAHYRIVTASDSANGELFSLRLELVAANDLLSRAIVLEDEGFEIPASNRGATAQPFEIDAPHAGVGAGHSVWFRWSAPFSGLFSLNTEGSDTDTVVAVYTGDPSNPVGFTSVGANDDVSATYRWSRVDFEAVQGIAYYIAVDTAMGGVPGSFILRGAVPSAPVIVSEPTDQEIPIGGRAVLSVGADGTPPLRYQWFRNGEALPGAWESSIVIDPFTEDSPGSYHAVVGNSFGSIASDSAQLKEKLIAPTIIWDSGDQALVAGGSVSMRVEARGSRPLAYEWRHNGALLPGEGAASLGISSISAIHAGSYECRVSNAVGQAEATIRITVVASPFDSWQWRLAEMPGPGVSEIKAIDNKVYAVCGDRIMVSADGIEWTPWMLPSEFEGFSLAKLDGTWLCVGEEPSGNGRCVTSANGVNWSVPQVLTGLPGTTPLQRVEHIEVFNGRFIGQRESHGDVYTSTNGIAWTKATLDGEATVVPAYGPFAVGSGVILTGLQESSNPPRAYRSVNGTDWTRVALPANGTKNTGTRGATRWNNKFVLFCSSCSPLSEQYGWESDDGINWTLQIGSSWPDGVDYNGDFVSLGGTNFDGLSVGWAADPWTATQTFIKPATGDVISAYCVFNGRVVYGTQRGFLGSLTEAGELTPFGGKVDVPTQIAFLDNRFFVLKNSYTGHRNGTPLVSGDGSNWRKMRRWTWSSENRYAAHLLAGFGGGHFWGTNRDNDVTGPGMGLLPHVMPEIPVANGLPPGVTSLEANGNTLLATFGSRMYRSADGGGAWTELANAPSFGSTSIKPAAAVTRSGTRWLLTNGDSTYLNYGFVHYSDDDGTSWTKTTAKAGFVTPFNGGLYGLQNLTSSPGAVAGWTSSNNGTSWATVTFNVTNKLANVEILRLGTFDGSLVALVRDFYGRSVWFSKDGVSWFAARTPIGITDFATGLGQFVAYTDTGAIVQAGAPPAGGAAPVVRTDYPVHESAVVSGSWVDVTGEAFDPGGGAITLECLVDGQWTGSSGEGAFHFRFRGTNPDGHVVILRATDAAGLVGSDELRVTVTPPQGTNLMESAEGRDYLPRVAMVEFGGAFYAAGDTGILRSTDGVTWEPVLLPSLSSKLKGLAAGNGGLVAQTDRGVLYTTRDGVNWQQVGPASDSGYGIVQPVIFSGGRFLVIQRGGSSMSFRMSSNGLDWTSAFDYNDVQKVTIGANGVMVSIRQDQGFFGVDKAVWSADGGYNWTFIPGIERMSGQGHTFAMTYGDGVFLIANSDGRAWRSTDGKSWIMDNLPGSPTTGVAVRHAGGRFFVGSETQLLYSAPATIGGTWQALSSGPMSDAVIHAAGRFIARGASGMAWSQDGVSWHDAHGGPTLPIGSRLAFNGERILVVDADGAAWSSGNGVNWRLEFGDNRTQGYTDSQLGQQMAALGSSLLLAGTNGMLHRSVDEGATWVPATADGAAVPSDWHFNRVQVSGGTAIATTNGNGVLRSTDGLAWQSLAALAAQRIVDVAGDGSGTWLAVGRDAAVLRSTDHGATWQPTINPGMAQARAVAWFNDEWVIFGSVTGVAPSRCWSSPDGSLWTDRGPNGLHSSSSDLFRVEGHGKLVVWNRARKPIITGPGLTWQPLPFDGLSNILLSTLYWVAPTNDGFLAATPFISSQAQSRMFRCTPDGLSWVEIPRFQNDTVWGADLNTRLFLFSPGRVTEWTERDLELELSPVSMATLGVADDLQSPAVLRNLGPVSISGPFDVDGWLSADGFFGDGNDVYVGRIRIDAPVIPPGGEAAIILSFELPGNIKPGNSRLVVVLDPEQTFLEINRANNVSISSTPAVSVPQRTLELLANGNGTVNSDQNAEYYPHGARIALVATPGKGARFAGWGGDAVGSLSETLVIMDADKSVEADFISTAALTVFTRGGGAVQQAADDGIYVSGSTANLTVVPLPGWTFSGWSGALSGNQGAESLLMDSNKVVTARFSLGLEAWKSQRFSAGELADPSISGDDADADRDGLENWREWLRGSDPRNRDDPGQSAARLEGEWLVLSYSRMENLPDGHAVRASASADLGDWSLPLDERVVGSANGVETIEARVDVTGLPNVFLRVGDTRPAP